MAEAEAQWLKPLGTHLLAVQHHTSPITQQQMEHRSRNWQQAGTPQTATERGGELPHAHWVRSDAIHHP